MKSDSPTVVIVPGFWTSATGVFNELVTRLQERGFKVIVAELRSTGHGSSDAITLDEDIAAVRGYIETVVLKGCDMVVAAHSAGW